MKRILISGIIALCSINSHAQFSANNKEIYIPSQCSAVSGRYLVRTSKNPGLNKGSQSTQDYISGLVASYGGTLLAVFEDPNATYSGFGVDGMNATNALNMLKGEEDVLLVEQVCTVTATGIQAQPGWALDRLDQSDLPLDASFDYPSYNGNRTHVYIIDQAIRGFFPGTSLLHQDLVAVRGSATVDHVHFRPEIPEAMRNSLACTIHGTAVAGLVGGANTGVARHSILHSYPAFDCQSPARSDTFYVRNALNHILANHSLNYPGARAVINLSADIAGSAEIAQSIRDLNTQQIYFVVAMANSGSDGCSNLIRSLPESITVGASGSSQLTNGIPSLPDRRWESSNYGTCTDIYAPGSAVQSTTAVNSSSLSSVTGTSFAAPLVTGTVAVYLEQNPLADFADVLDALKTNASLNRVSNVPSGDNDLLNICFLNGSCDTTPPPSCNSDIFEQDDTAATSRNYTLPSDTSGATAGLTIVSDSGWRNHNYCDDSEDWTKVNNLSAAIGDDGYYHFISAYFDTSSDRLDGSSNSPVCVVRYLENITGGSAKCDDNDPQEDTYPAGQMVLTVTAKTNFQSAPPSNSINFQYHPQNGTSITGNDTDYRMRLVHYKCRLEDLPCNAPNLFQ